MAQPEEIIQIDQEESNEVPNPINPIQNANLEENEFLHKLGRIIYLFLETSFTLITFERIHPREAYSTCQRFGFQFPKYIFPPAQKYLEIVSKKAANLIIEGILTGISFTILHKKELDLRFMFDFLIDAIINKDVELSEELLKSIRAKLGRILISLRKFALDLPKRGESSHLTIRIALGCLKEHYDSTHPNGPFISEDIECFPWKKINIPPTAKRHFHSESSKDPTSFPTSLDKEISENHVPKFGEDPKVLEVPETTPSISLHGIETVELYEGFSIDLSAILYPPPSKPISSLPLFKKNFLKRRLSSQSQNRADLKQEKNLAKYYLQRDSMKKK